MTQCTQGSRMATIFPRCPQRLMLKRFYQSPAQWTSSPAKPTPWASKWKGFAVTPTCAFTKVLMWGCIDSQSGESQLSFGVLSFKAWKLCWILWSLQTVSTRQSLVYSGITSWELSGQNTSKLQELLTPFINIWLYSCYYSKLKLGAGFYEKKTIGDELGAAT